MIHRPTDDMAREFNKREGEKLTARMKLCSKSELIMLNLARFRFEEEDHTEAEVLVFLDQRLTELGR